MIRCETCRHECSQLDFVTLRNLCEHLYLDSLAEKPDAYSSWYLKRKKSLNAVPQTVS